MFVINATDYAPVTPVTPPCDIIPIFIGYKGENHARCLIFDLTDCIEEFGNGGFAISFMRHGDAQPYIVTDTDSLETTAIWEINATDTAVEGYGMVQLQYIVGETVCKTAMYRTITFDSNESAGDVPDPYENLLDQIAAYAAQAQGSAAAAERAAVNAATQADRILSTTADAVGDWLEDNIGEISGYVIDKSLTVSDAAADAKVAGDWIRASFITDTASGSVASLPDGADGVPVKDLTVSVQAVQSGTGDPSPSNVRPITGWTKANVCVGGDNLRTGVTFNDGYINADGEVVVNPSLKHTDDYIPCISGLKYLIYVIPALSSSRIRIHEYNANKEWLRQIYVSDPLDNFDPTVHEWTASSDAVYFRFSTPNFRTLYVHQGNVYTVSFGSVGTVYGGTLDVTTGVLTVTHGYYEFTAGTTYTPQQTSGGIWFIQTPSLSGIVSSSTELVSNQYKTVVTSGSAVVDKCIRSLSDHVNVYDNSFTSAAAVETILTANPIQIVYPLTTPQTFALTPTQVTSLLGNNNIFADCGASDVTYRADPRLYLEKLTNPDSDMTADANIASGSYFMVGNRLYLATSAIALGASIVPGTNCTATDLASALNAINT